MEVICKPLSFGSQGLQAVVCRNVTTSYAGSQQISNTKSLFQKSVEGKGKLSQDTCYRNGRVKSIFKLLWRSCRSAPQAEKMIKKNQILCLIPSSASNKWIFNVHRDHHGRCVREHALGLRSEVIFKVCFRFLLRLGKHRDSSVSFLGSMQVYVHGLKDCCCTLFKPDLRVLKQRVFKN